MAESADEESLLHRIEQERDELQKNIEQLYLQQTRRNFKNSPIDLSISPNLFLSNEWPPPVALVVPFVLHVM